jgi:general secretion pathway protein G
MRRAGFTLIEFLIVTVTVAILASFVIPRLLGASREARETRLRADLHELRHAINLFQACCGDYPDELTDLLLATAPASGGNGVPINPADWRGPYITTSDGDLPIDPVTGERDWKYEEETGEVRSASQAVARDGTRYRDW